MEEKKLFTAPRWNDVPQATVIGHREISEKEKRQIMQEVVDELYDGKWPEGLAGGHGIKS